MFNHVNFQVEGLGFIQSDFYFLFFWGTILKNTFPSFKMVFHVKFEPCNMSPIGVFKANIKSYLNNPRSLTIHDFYKGINVSFYK